MIKPYSLDPTLTSSSGLMYSMTHSHWSMPSLWDLLMYHIQLASGSLDDFTNLWLFGFRVGSKHQVSNKHSSYLTPEKGSSLVMCHIQPGTPYGMIQKLSGLKLAPIPVSTKGSTTSPTMQYYQMSHTYNKPIMDTTLCWWCQHLHIQPWVLHHTVCQIRTYHCQCLYPI